MKMEPEQLIEDWSTAGYDTLALRSSEISVYPCHAQDVPDGAVDSYCPINSPEALSALTESIRQGYRYSC